MATPFLSSPVLIMRSGLLGSASVVGWWPIVTGLGLALPVTQCAHPNLVLDGADLAACETTLQLGDGRVLAGRDAAADRPDDDADDRPGDDQRDDEADREDRAHPAEDVDRELRVHRRISLRRPRCRAGSSSAARRGPRRHRTR